MAGLAASLVGCDRLTTTGPAAFKGIDVTGADYGRRFSLKDPDGRIRTLEEFRGKAVLLYFGFAQCPDVCPTALFRAVNIRKRLGPEGERLQVVFVTVDPERDSPVVLKAYMAAFDSSFIALSGTPDEIRDTAREFRAYYAKVPTGSSYTMDHTALSYLFDPKGQLRLILKHAQTEEEYAHDIALLLKGR